MKAQTNDSLNDVDAENAVEVTASNYREKKHRRREAAWHTLRSGNAQPLHRRNMTKKSAKIPPPKQTPCARCPLKSIAVFRAFQPDELEFVEWFKSGEFVTDAGATILMEGHSSPHLYTVLQGWAFRYKTFPDGRRQILNFAMPGDFLGLQTSMFNEMQHSVETLTKTVLCVFPREKIWTLYEKFPNLAFDLTWLASRSESLLDEQLLSLGRQSAIERVAYALLHIYFKAVQLGLSKSDKVAFPFTQQHLADALGLSLVHTNKTLKSLIDKKTIRWKEGVFELINEAKLREIASFEGDGGQTRPLI